MIYQNTNRYGYIVSYYIITIQKIVKMKRYLPFILLSALLFTALFAGAQCAMCKATAETSRDAGSSVAEGINKGILYIFMMPYIIIGTIAFFWWKARKKAGQEI